MSQPYIPDGVLRKLAEKHGVSASEVFECFANRGGLSLIDDREQHRTDPPTRWFIAETDMGRILKVVYVPDGNGYVVKTAYRANAVELQIYAAHAGVSFT